MSVWFSNADRHKSHCRLQKCTERSLDCAGELDAANSSGSLPAVSGEQELWGHNSGMAGTAVSGVYEVAVTGVKL